LLAQRPPPSLGTAASFAVLASTVTSSGSTVVTGNLGGNTIRGFPPGLVLLGTTIRNGEIAAPLLDSETAYEDLRLRPCAQQLEGDGLAPGVYCRSLPYTLQGTLTLDAKGDPNAFWIFQLRTGLSTAPASAVRVINGGWEGNVFWQVEGQAALGEGTAFIGNILSSKSIILGAGATLSGRALALDGAVTLSANAVSICCKPITVSNPAVTAAAVLSPFNVTFTQSGGAAPVVFTMGSGTLPAGLNLAENGTLSGATAQRGTFPITVRATDATHCTGMSAVYVLTVACAPIVITNPANDRGTAGVPFSETFTQTGAAVNATVDAIFTTDRSKLPAGLALASNGTLAGTPTQRGTFPISVRVTGANGCYEDSTIYRLVIDCPIITVTNPTNASGTAGVPFCERFTQTGAAGTATFTLATGTLPPGLTLSPDGFLCGIPTQTGPISITVTVTDSNNCTGTSPPYNPLIGCQKITVVPPATTTGITGIPFCEAFTATGILGTATFSSSGVLPAGVTFMNGILCGTPVQAGCFPITVTATDTNGCTGTSTYVLCISGVPMICPSITATPVTAPPAVNAVPYLQPIIVTGGTPPYSFAVTSGTLPAGLFLTPAGPSGSIFGVPTVSADIDVTITITDANGCKGILVYYPATIPALSPWGLAALFCALSALALTNWRRG
jgi:hypothetical protein